MMEIDGITTEEELKTKFAKMRDAWQQKIALRSAGPALSMPPQQFGLSTPPSRSNSGADLVGSGNPAEKKRLREAMVDPPTAGPPGVLSPPEAPQAPLLPAHPVHVS